LPTGLGKIKDREAEVEEQDLGLLGWERAATSPDFILGES